MTGRLGHRGVLSVALLEHLEGQARAAVADAEAHPERAPSWRPLEDYALGLEAAGVLDDLSERLSAAIGETVLVGFEDPEDPFYAGFYIPVTADTEDGHRHGAACALSRGWEGWLEEQLKDNNYGPDTAQEA